LFNFRIVYKFRLLHFQGKLKISRTWTLTSKFYRKTNKLFKKFTWLGISGSWLSCQTHRSWAL